MPHDDLADIVREQYLESIIQGPGLPVPMTEKDLRSIKTNLQFERGTERTFVVVLALHKDVHRNTLQKLKCDWGSPLGGYVYDHVNDCYYVKCIDYQHLGYIPFTCWLRLKDNNFWKVCVPLPEALLLRNLDNESSNKLKYFKSRNKEQDFQYMQLID